jgi:hypothetical protein
VCASLVDWWDGVVYIMRHILIDRCAIVTFRQLIKCMEVKLDVRVSRVVLAEPVEPDTDGPASYGELFIELACNIRLVVLVAWSKQHNTSILRQEG